MNTFSRPVFIKTNFLFIKPIGSGRIKVDMSAIQLKMMDVIGDCIWDSCSISQMFPVSPNEEDYLLSPTSTDPAYKIMERCDNYENMINKSTIYHCPSVL